MEIISNTEYYQSIKRYWKRRQYECLGVTGKDKRCVRLGGKRKRTWNINITRKLKLGFKMVSPMKMLAKLRDAYIDFMPRLVGNVGSLNNENFFGKKRVPESRRSAKVSNVTDFESKLILEIYKSLKVSQELASD